MIIALPGFVSAGFATGVGQLDAGHRTMLFQESANASQWLDVLIKVQSAIGRANATLGRNGGRFDNHQASSPDRSRTQVHKMPVIKKTILGGILAHRRYSNAIPKHYVLQTKFVK
jgi:hypothetical protein